MFCSPKHNNNRDVSAVPAALLEWHQLIRCQYSSDLRRANTVASVESCDRDENMWHITDRVCKTFIGLDNNRLEGGSIALSPGRVWIRYRIVWTP
jgi:hypothetical protein